MRGGGMWKISSRYVNFAVRLSAPSSNNYYSSRKPQSHVNPRVPHSGALSLSRGLHVPQCSCLISMFNGPNHSNRGAGSPQHPCPYASVRSLRAAAARRKLLASLARKHRYQHIRCPVVRRLPRPRPRVRL